MAPLLLPARAHEVRPAYLQIDEVAPGRYSLLWRTPGHHAVNIPEMQTPMPRPAA